MIGIADLKDEFFKLHASSMVKNMDRTIPPDYCHFALCPIGLVAEEIAIEDIPVGYALTRAGIEFGQPCAAKILEFEREEGYSIYPIFGGIGRKSNLGKEVPFIRARILFELAKHDSLREVDISQMLGIYPGTAKRSLEALVRAEAVEYHSVHPQTGKTKVDYRTGNPSVIVRTVGTASVFTDEVAKVSFELSRQGIPITQGAVFDRLPLGVRAGWKEKVLRHQISATLSGPTEQGFLERGLFKGHQRQSIASLTDKGRVVAEELIKPLLAALGDIRELEYIGKHVLPKVLTNLPEYAQITGDLYYPYSRAGRKRERGDTIIKALEYIKENPGVTIENIASFFN